MKRCRVCQNDFEPTLSQIKKSNWICVVCRKIESKINLQKRKERGLPISGTKMPRKYHEEYEKKYYQREDVKQKRAAQMRERRQNPEESKKMLAREMTNKAIKYGRLKKQPCEVCGVLKVDAHHDDYFKPLNVRWLCREHHIEHHAKARGES